MVVKQSIHQSSFTMTNLTFSVLSVILFVTFGLLNAQETNVIEIIEESPAAVAEEVLEFKIKPFREFC